MDLLLLLEIVDLLVSEKTAHSFHMYFCACAYSILSVICAVHVLHASICSCACVCMYVCICMYMCDMCVCDMCGVCMCRCHIVEEFNRGVYDYIIATDEAPEIDVVGGQRRRGLKRRKDKEYGVVRGIDFKGMATRALETFYIFGVT